MKAMIKKLILAFFLVILGLAAIVVARAALLLPETSNQQPARENAELDPLEFDINNTAKILSEAIKIETISRQSGPTASKEFDKFQLMLRAAFPNIFTTLSIETISDHSLLMIWQGSDPSLEPLIFMAHIDVVPVSKTAHTDWLHPPFGGVIASEFVWGRGATDDKGSLIAICQAVEALIAKGFTPTRTVILSFGHDEEIGGNQGAAKIVEKLQEDDIKAWMVIDEGTSVITQHPLTQRPAALISIGEKGYATLRITAHSEGGHSSAPTSDIGIYTLSEAALAIREAPFPAYTKETVAPMTRALMQDLTFMQKLLFANFWLFEGLIEHQMTKSATTNSFIRTTIAPTILEGSPKENVLPRRVSMVVNHRIHPLDTPQDVVDHIREATRGIEQLEIGFEGKPRSPSPISSTDNDAYRVLEAAIRQQFPKTPVVPVILPAATDAKWFTSLSDSVYRFSPYEIHPNQISMIHGINERVSLANLETMVRFYGDLIQMSSQQPSE